MDTLFSKNIEDKEVYFKEKPNDEGIKVNPLFDVAEKKDDKGKSND